MTSATPATFHTSHDGTDHTITATASGLVVYVPGRPPRRITWSSVLDLPVGWQVISDGWVVGRFDAERDAHDKAAELRSCGAAVSVAAVPAY